VATYSLDPKTIDMLDTYRRVSPGGVNTDIIMAPIGRDTYAALANKDQEGAPIQYLFDRQIAPTVTVWPVPDATTTYSMVTYIFSQIGDADPSGGNQPNVPYRFLESFTADLAASLAMKWAPVERAVALKGYADEVFAEAASEDHEAVVTTMAPDLTAYFT
jgi:hypothetical protein